MKISLKFNYAALLTLAPVVLLTGCGLGVSPLTTTTASSPVTMSAGTRGTVMGGQQPVAAISLQIYAVGTTGYGSAATPLLPTGASAVKTDANGNFTLPAINCPTPTSLVYLVGTGGQPIAATANTAAVTNNNLALMVGIGSCSLLGDPTVNPSAIKFINMNEITTVASVWALSPFMVDAAHVGSSSTNSTGITNAFAAINKLTDITKGTIAVAPSNTTLPVQKITTLADILEQCVNSGGGSASDSTNGSNGTGCGNLFYLAGGASTTDTVTAALVIAHNPSTNVTALNKLPTAQPVFPNPYGPNTPPTDWSLVVSYTGGGLNSPQAIATDQQGNVWVANAGGTGSVSEFSSTGTALSPAAGFTGGGLISAPYALAVDQSNNVWVANSTGGAGTGSISELSSAGASLANYTGNGLSTPKGIAIDGTGNVFVANNGSGSVSGFTSAGATLTGSPFTGAGISAPVAIAINPK